MAKMRCKMNLRVRNIYRKIRDSMPDVSACEALRRARDTYRSRPVLYTFPFR